MWWDGKLSLCDQRDGQVFMTLDCNIPTAGDFQVVKDERTPVLVKNSSLLASLRNRTAEGRRR